MLYDRCFFDFNDSTKKSFELKINLFIFICYSYYTKQVLNFNGFSERDTSLNNLKNDVGRNFSGTFFILQRETKYYQINMNKCKKKLFTKSDYIIMSNFSII